MNIQLIGNKVNRKRRSRESFSSDSSIADSNQNKMSRRTGKYGNQNKSRESNNRAYLNGNGVEGDEKVEKVVNGQCDAGKT